MKERRCKCGCGSVVRGHPNKRFVNQQHKDRYWNRVNPRGKFAHLNPENDNDYAHPFDGCDGLGQD